MAEPTTAPNTAAGAKPGNRRTKIANATDTALQRARSAVAGLETNPIGVLASGLAVGLVAGALVPRSEREKAALRPVGKRLAEGAVAAVAAAKASGKEQLSATVLGREAVSESARKVFDSALGAAKGTGAKKTPEVA